MTRHATRDGNPAVLISGASTGIGEASALRMHARGFTVYAGVRRTEDGDAVRARAGSDRLVPVLLDVTSEQHIAEVRRRIEAERGESGLDGLVNNAGIAAAGPLEFLPITELRRQLEVNVIGQVALTQAMLPALRRARGRIIFVGSIAGRSALPFVGAYAASKFAIEAIADSLRVELVESGIHVSVVEPGSSNCLYHSESQQEAFLVLSGEYILLVEGEQRRLAPWDFVHCPAGTEHVFVGAGDGPCAILMVGVRSADEKLHYPASELAAKYGASAERATDDPKEAYARFARPERGRPSYWDRLPWA